MQAEVSNNAFHPPDPAGCGQQVFLTVFGKPERLNVDRVGAGKPIEKEIWSLQYHCKLTQCGMVFLASIFHLLCVLVLVCRNILITLLQTLASNPTSTQYDGEYWEQGLKLPSLGRAGDIWVSRFNPSQQLSTTQPLTHCPPTPGMGERIRKKNLVS